MPFPKGVSGNPKGRPPDVKYFTEAAREMLKSKKIDISWTTDDGETKSTRRIKLKAQKNFYHSLIAAQIHEGLGGNARAISSLIDRIEGKPHQSVDLTTLGKELKSMPSILVSNDQTAEALKEVIEKNNAIQDDDSL